jgi:membrane-associated phospholipid phosphatase
MHGQVSGGDRDRPRGTWPVMVLLAVALYGGAVAIFADLAGDGVSIRIDTFVANLWTFKGPYSYLLADQLDRIGMREICVPFLIIGAIAICRRVGSIRAVVIATVGTLALNFAVGVLKLASGRESPRTGGPEMFAGDNVLYPSGHAANVIFHYGLVVALMIRYGMVSSAWRRRLYVTLVVMVFVLMTWVSVYRHTHWFSDLMAGGLIGTALLVVCLAADREWGRLVPLLRRLAGPTWVLVERPIEWVRPYIMVPGRERRRRRDAAALAAAGAPGVVQVAGQSVAGSRSPAWGNHPVAPGNGGAVRSFGSMSGSASATALEERGPRDPREPDALTGPPV